MQIKIELMKKGDSVLNVWDQHIAITRKNGDVIQPFSHSSKIKLKDYFIDKKIPEHKRDEIMLLC